MEIEREFVSIKHKQLFEEATRLLNDEIIRQTEEALRLTAEWDGLPIHRRLHYRAWLTKHFAECRKPYEKVLRDILELCPQRIIVKLTRSNSPPT